MLLSLNSFLIGLVKKRLIVTLTHLRHWFCSIYFITVIILALFVCSFNAVSVLSTYNCHFSSVDIFLRLPIAFFVLLHIVHSIWRITVEFIPVPSSLSFAYEKNHIQFSFFFLWWVHVPSYINLFLPFFFACNCMYAQPRNAVVTIRRMDDRCKW